MAMKDEIAQIRKRMDKAIDDIRKELSSIRTGRASISILDNIQVDYYGVPTPINQVAQLICIRGTLHGGLAGNLSLVEKSRERLVEGLHAVNILAGLHHRIDLVDFVLADQISNGRIRHQDFHCQRPSPTISFG